MNRRLKSQAVKERAVQRGAHALAPAADVKRDADLNGLPESLVVPVALGTGVAQDLIAAPGHQKPVGPGRSELAGPLAPFGHADRPSVEVGDRVGPRVVEDADDRRKVILGRRRDLDLGRSALVAAGSLLHGHTVAASPGDIAGADRGGAIGRYLAARYQQNKMTIGAMTCSCRRAYAVSWQGRARRSSLRIRLQPCCG